MKCNFFLLFALLASLAHLENAHAGSIVLDWNPSASPQVAGYNVYFGTTSGKYPYKLRAGNAKSTTISNLTVGATYYFAATAYDASGNESGYSGEIKVVVPFLLSLVRGATARNPALLQFPVQPGHWYEIQAATNCRNWNWIWRSGLSASNGVMTFTDLGSTASRSRFYRLVAY